MSIDRIAASAKEAVRLGIPVIALFPVTPLALKTDDGREAINPENLMCRAIKAIRDAVGDSIGILTDVALDPYTTHGQDGLVEDGYVVNDATIEVLKAHPLSRLPPGQTSSHPRT